LRTKKAISKTNVKPYWQGEYAPSLSDPANLYRLLDLFFATLNNDRDVKIIKMRYGLDNGIAHTLASIGRYFRISRERVRQVEKPEYVSPVPLMSARKLRDPSMEFFFSILIKPITSLLKNSGGLMPEDDISKKLEQIALLGDYHPAGVTSFILKFAQDIIQLENRVWALNDVSVASVEDIRTRAIYLLTSNLTRMRCEQLVSDIAINLGAKTISTSFIKACLRTCSALRINDNGWCLLRRWESKYIDNMVEILRNARQPLHYKDVAVEVNKLLNLDKPVAEHSVHATLFRTTDIFVWTEPGTYGLLEWALDGFNSIAGDPLGTQTCKTLV